jgi:tripartite-type tricarboxylate transporter receptor subunit TctC
MKLFKTIVIVLFSIYAMVADAQEYPSRPVRIIVPYAAGGGNDITTRIVAQKLSENTGKAFVVENRPGAGGRIGYEVVARAPADGYTISVTDTGYNILAALYGATLPWDSATDLVPVTQLGNWSFVILVNPKLNVKSLQGLIDLAKAHPGKLNYGSAGNGSINQMGAELFKREANVNIMEIPYKGMGDALVGMLSGSIDVMVIGTAPILSHIKAGKLIPLAVASTHRSSVLPDVPSTAEVGYPGIIVGNWVGFSAPKGTPRDVIDWLRSEVLKAVTSPDVRERFAVSGVEPSGMTPDEYGALMQNDVQRWAEVIRAAGIKAPGLQPQ